MNLIDSASLVVTPNGYKASKLYSIIPSDGSGDMTFARTGNTATRVNSSGLIEPINANIPRLDYLGGGCPKLLLEPQRTNLNTYSDAFDNAAWTKLALTTTANTIASPDGTTNADSIFETIANDYHVASQSKSFTSGTAYTLSVFVKPNGRNFARILFGGNVFGNKYANFNLVTDEIVNTAGVTAKIESYSNGWKRCIATATAINSATEAVYFGPARNTTDGYITYTGDASLGIYAYGAQLEVGAYATSYIPTTTASVTRNQDTCEKTSATALIGQTEGTIFADFVLASLDESRVLIGDGTASNRIYLRVAPNGSLLFEVIIGTVTLATISTNVSFASIGSRYKLAAVYKTNDFAFYINGVQIGVDTSGTIANALTRFALDGYITTYANFNHKINSLALWKTRLQNSELATLTTL